MSNTSGLTLEQLKAKRSELESQGKSLSTSKEMGKVENAIKVLNPSNYGANQVASAQLALKSSTQPGAVGAGGNLSSLERLLADKQKAVTNAMADINDNPWYSEATRVGKLGKLQEQSQAEIANINQQISQARADQEMAFKMEQANKPNVQTITDNAGTVTAYDVNTGQVMYTLPGTGRSYGGGGGEKKDENEVKITDGGVARAVSHLKEQDAAIKGKGEDGYLSTEELKQATEDLAREIGNYDLADALIAEAMNRFNYHIWGA